MIITLKVPCSCCPSIKSISVVDSDFDSWVAGKKLIQKAFPYLNPGEREILMSGICSGCFDAMMGSDAAFG
jgi:hypothetical protein